jgi:transcriptional regulator with XRE-family HTH domain
MVVINPRIPTSMAISDEERTFFIGLGERVAAIRKQQGITQVQLAETLDVSQQTLQAYEVGRRRFPVSALPVLAQTLAVTLEELMGEPAKKNSKRGPAPKLAQHMERISQLPKPQQRFVMQVIESVLAQQGR